MANHHFHLKAEWPGGRNSVGKIEAGNLKTEISIPPEMDGPGTGTNPDEMLLGAAATCYVITLGAMIERSGLALEEMNLESEGIVEVEKGVFTYKKIIHRPVVVMPQGTEADDYKKMTQLVEKAEQSCMITRAVKGNVEITLEPDVSVAEGRE